VRDVVLEALARSEGDVRTIEAALAEAEQLRAKLAALETEQQLHAAMGAHLSASGFEKWLLDEALTLAPGAHGPARYSVLLTQGAVLLLGIVLQTAVCRETDSLRAPFTFVAGVVIGFLPWQTAAFALSLAAVVALGVRAPGLFFLFVGIAVVPMGFLFSGKSFLPRLSITFVVLSLPLLLSLLARRPLVVEYRARRADSDTVAK
jgi:hypothetical protein